MSTVIEDREAYKENFRFYDKRIYGDFTPFYIAVTFCTILGVFLFVLNIALGCCSRYSKYWNDRHTGNRWIISFWTSTPHNQPPLDYTELEYITVPHKEEHEEFEPKQSPKQVEVESVELQKRESEI